ncbi:YceD family protein [Thalassococcus sp. BH17M4-6]|uniref:YceD family protein n=1 Tax=Thalassococcus sp. BH17M4-6 TaxID=3413148 RepID=UPI003BD91519
MAAPKSAPGVFRVAALSTGQPTAFDLRPDAEARRVIAEEIGLLALRKLSFEGTLTPTGKRGWELNATLGATVVQPCVVTLEPVTTRIDEPVIRQYLPDLDTRPVDPGAEIEMPEDDTIDPLGDVIDASAVMIEALSLALPLYPRADGAELGEAVFAEDGTTPIRDADLKPFAGLEALKNKLEDKD